MTKNIITITTDFGDDFSLAQLKTEILSINPRANIVIASNEITPYNIKEGSFVISEIAKHSPAGTVHVGVIDPGVGTDRDGIIVVCEDQVFVGPNNGLFGVAGQVRGIKQVIKIKESLVNENATKTFHGRDIFAKVAARLTLGEKPHNFGVQLEHRDVIQLNYYPDEILYIDPYGNIKINNNCDLFNIGDRLAIKFNGKQRIIKYCQTFSEVLPGELLAYRGSNNCLEIAINQGNVAAVLGSKVGDILTVEKC
jgi:S-adenosylmethionine hydrolase